MENLEEAERKIAELLKTSIEAFKQAAESMKVMSPAARSYELRLMSQSTVDALDAYNRGEISDMELGLRIAKAELSRLNN
jgi:hypothetical protein